jgi:cytochrome P450
LTGIGNPDHTELLQYFSDLLHERKRDVRDDLISELLAAEGHETYLSYSGSLAREYYTF